MRLPPMSKRHNKEPYPIPDEQHARSALGFAKMHHPGDTNLLAKIRAKVHRKYPGMITKKRGGSVKVEGHVTKHRMDRAAGGRAKYDDGGNVSDFTRHRGQIKLREEMGGEPAFFGPINRGLYGISLKGKPQSDVEATKQRQMKESEDISDAVPRKRGGKAR